MELLSLEVFDVIPADLEEAPLFDFDEWVYPSDDNWDTEIRSYWDGM